MKILINTAHQRFGGAIQVALSFIHECKKFNEHEFYVWIGPGVSKLLNIEEFPENFSFKKFDFGTISLKKAFEINKVLQTEESIINPDCIISTTGPTYFHSKAPQIIGFNLPLYIYPESPYVKQFSGISKLKFNLKKRLHFYFFKRDASAFVCQTEDVKDRVQKALKTKKVYTVTNTASSYYLNWELLPKKLPVNNDKNIRLLTISSYYGHKNLEIIPSVVKILSERGIQNVEFILTLKENDYKSYIGEQEERIYNVGPIRPNECPSLYDECDIMFLPTLAECFSASYPEAMIMEKPIVTTDLGFAKSICGESALYFEPKNAYDAAEKIEKLINDLELQKSLVVKGKEQLKKFDSPSERARKYISLCEELAQKT